MKLRVTGKVIEDLAGIGEFIARNNPENAVRLVCSFQDLFALVAAQPGTGRSRPELGVGIRTIVHGDYVVAYRAHDDYVLIMRVYHGARRPPEMGR
jgi:toxin ParE1/3/4